MSIGRFIVPKDIENTCRGHSGAPLPLSILMKVHFGDSSSPLTFGIMG